MYRLKLPLESISSILITILLSCNSDIANKESSDNCVKITISGKIDNELQIDSIFSKRVIVPLETTDECLVGEISKIMDYENKIFILDKFSKLFAFDISGKFLFFVGRQGRGPGEFSSIRDFDIDESGNLYLLGYQRILKYDNNGKFLKTFDINSVSNGSEYFCNPLEFAVKWDGNFYVWGGSFGIKDNSEGKYFAMYEISNQGQVINKYIPLRYSTTEGFERHRFVRHKDFFLVEPNYGVDTIYSLNEQGLKPRYYIDFGNKKIQSQVPELFDGLMDFKLKIDQLSYHSIQSFLENDEWVYFRFQHKVKRYNVYYSKNLQQSFVSRYHNFSGFNGPGWITNVYNENLIGYCEAQNLINDINKNCPKINLYVAENSFIKDLSKIKPTDNPIIYLCYLKKY